MNGVLWHGQLPQRASVCHINRDFEEPQSNHGRAASDGSNPEVRAYLYSEKMVTRAWQPVVSIELTGVNSKMTYLSSSCSPASSS
jgi:hypothetical protein